MNNSTTNIDSQAERKFLRVQRFTLKSAVVNALISVVKLLAGLLGGSYALVADALNSTADFIQDMMALLYLKMGHRDKDDHHDYGYGRYATVASLFAAVILFAVGVYIVIHAVVLIVDFFTVGHEVVQRPAWVALVAAVLAVVLKGGWYFLAHQKADELKSRFVAVNAGRYRLDALSSVSTAVAVAFAVLLSPKWKVLDPIAALIVAGFIIRMAALAFRHTIDELLDKSLPEKTEKQIAAWAKGVEHVIEVNKVLSRRVGGMVSIELVVMMDGAMTLNQVHKSVVKIEDLLHEKFHEIAHLAIHVEPAPDVHNVTD